MPAEGEHAGRGADERADHGSGGDPTSTGTAGGGPVDTPLLTIVEAASVTRATVVVGVAAGGVASFALVGLGLAPWSWLGVGTVGGGVVAAAVGPRAVGTGRGLTWGLAAAMLAWLLVLFPLAGTVEAGVGVGPGTALPLLPRSVLGVGAPAGVAVGWWQGRGADRPSLNLPRALVGGGIAGLAGGIAFGVWMRRAGVLPRVAGLVGADSVLVGGVVHFAIAATIGITFAVLFQRDVRGYGSALGWGLTYGLLWWVLGAGTLFPLLGGRAVEWSAAALSARLGSLVGHLVFGVLLGVVYGLVDRLWRVLFYESDPLHRHPVGPGIESLRAARWGALASLGGGLLFGGLLFRTGQLPTVASLVGSDSPAVGFVVHLLVGMVIGITYGQLFRHEAPDPGAGAAWGLVYGVVWWVVGPLTLLPTFLGRPLVWNAVVIERALPLLFGHLVYGVVTGVAFSVLERHRREWAGVNPRIAEHESERRRPIGTSAPAVLLVAMTLVPLLVLLL